jgi:anti-sigma-K factor RskA
VRCSEFKEGAWAYALGALDPAERAQLERHLAESIAHEGCQAELDRAFRTASALGEDVPEVKPPEDAWSKIQSRIAREGEAKVLPFRRGGWAPWVVSLAAAAACFILLAKALSYRSAINEKNAELSRLSGVVAERDSCRQELEAMRQSSQMQRAALALLELPATRLVPLGPTPGSQTPSRGNALLNVEQQKAMVLITALAPAVGKDYELWVIREGNPPTPAGILKPGRDGRVIAEVSAAALQAGRPDIFAVTLEPPGGSPGPTTTPFLLGKVEKG